MTLAGWVNRSQRDVTEYLQEEKRVLREHLGGRRLHFTDAQRRRLANKAKAIGRQTLSGVGPVVTTDTLLRWYRTLVARKYLTHDRDPLFTEEFRAILKAGGVRTVKLPAQSPDLNAFAERFVRSIKEECLSQIIPLGERHLRRAVTDYTEPYHGERNHQGLGNDLIERPTLEVRGRIQCRERLGGVLKYYYRRAA
jgi:hypothetical protein